MRKIIKCLTVIALSMLIKGDTWREPVNPVSNMKTVTVEQQK